MVMADVKKLEVPEPLLRVGEAFREAGHELYLVGGYVRDRLLGGAFRGRIGWQGMRIRDLRRSPRRVRRGRIEEAMKPVCEQLESRITTASSPWPH